MEPACGSSSDRHPPTAAEQFLELLARLLAKRWLQQQRAEAYSPPATAAGPTPTPDHGAEDRSPDSPHRA